MAQSDLTRIRSNIQGLNILSSLRNVNNEVATHQLRLGTGKRINSAGDDPAGLSISTKLDARNRILGAVFDNIGQAKNLLSVAEGGLLSINDILVSMGEKVVTSANDALGTEERQAISRQLVQLVAEIDDIAEDTEFNGVNLLNSTTEFNFQTSDRDTTSYQTQSYTAANLGLANLTALTQNDTIDSTNSTEFLDEIDAAISQVSAALTDLGSLINRFTIKEGNISIAQINTEAAFSRIRNADLAKEQLELTNSQILQQTSTAMLAQATANSQSILQLFG